MKYYPVDLIEKDTQEFDYAIIEDFSRLLLRMESTNHCNFKCTFCPHPIMKRIKGFMNEELYQKVIDEAAGLGFVKLDLRNFGEPIIDKRLGKFAKYAYGKGLNKIYIHTNGYGLSVKMLDEWGESGFSDVNISLSPKREFAKSRPGTDVDRLFSDLEKVMQSDSKWKHILSVDYIKTGLSSDDEEKEFMDWLEKFNFTKRIDIDLHNWAEGAATKFRQCHRLWTSITVLWDGRVSLCCLDYEGDIEMGDVNRQSLKEIINGELYQEVRKNHINGLFLDKCSKCNMAEVKDLGPKPTYSKID